MSWWITTEEVEGREKRPSRMLRQTLLNIGGLWSSPDQGHRLCCAEIFCGLLHYHEVVWAWLDRQSVSCWQTRVGHGRRPPNLIRLDLACVPTQGSILKIGSRYSPDIADCIEFFWSAQALAILLRRSDFERRRGQELWSKTVVDLVVPGFGTQPVQKQG